jgi:hypothetical protein
VHCAAQADGPGAGLQARCWRRRRRTERVALHKLGDRVERRGSDGAAGLWGLDDVQEGRQVCQGLHGRPVCGGARALASRRSQRAGSSRAAPVQVNTCRRSDLNSSSSGSTASSSCGEGQRCIARHPGCARSGDRALLESHRVSVGRQRPLRVRPHSGHYSCDLMAHQQGARRGGRHLGQPHFTTAWTTRRPGETSSTQGGIGGAGGMGALLTARPFYWNSGNPRRAVHCWSGLGGKGPWPSNPQDVSRAWSGGGQWARAGRRPRWGTENCRWYRELSH